MRYFWKNISGKLSIVDYPSDRLHISLYFISLLAAVCNNRYEAKKKKDLETRDRTGARTYPSPSLFRATKVENTLKHACHHHRPHPHTTWLLSSLRVASYAFEGLEKHAHDATFLPFISQPSLPCLSPSLSLPAKISRGRRGRKSGNLRDTAVEKKETA